MFFADMPINIGVRINIWFWMMLAAAPIWVFLVGPERSALSHFFRVIGAIGLIYACLNLTIATSHSFDWVVYLQCQENSVHSDMSEKMQAECGHHINIADGAQISFAYLLGWIPAGMYVGIWEGIWRLRHRRKIRELGDDFNGKWFSNLVVISPLLLLVFVFALPVLFQVIDMFTPI